MHFRNRYDVIHVHNMPDFLVFTALLPKLFGSKIVLDLHDPMPELYMTKYAIGDDSAIIKLLKSLERWSINFADIVITPNIAFRNLFISRGCPAEKIHIVMNSPMESVFHTGTGDSIKADQNKADGFVIMFHGGIYERHGLDTALEVIANLRNEIPNIRFKVFGDGDYETQFMKLIDEHDLKSIVSYRGTVPLETISEEIRSIDVGIIPNKKNPFTDINFPVRIFEYLCLNKPVIVPRTRGIMDYFDDDSLFFFEPGNAESLAQALLKIHRNPVLCQEVNERAACVYSRYRWALQRQYLLELVGGLLAK
jgi:glycosyltransferase involved in cell wall biosynthesis